MKLLEIMLSEPIGILSLITVLGALGVIVFLTIFFLKNSAPKDGSK